MRAVRTIPTLLVPSLVFSAASVGILAGLEKDPGTTFLATFNGRFLCFASALLSAAAVTLLCKWSRGRSWGRAALVVGLAAILLVLCPPIIVMVALMTAERLDAMPPLPVLLFMPVLHPRGFFLLLFHMACTASGALLCRLSSRTLLVVFGTAVLAAAGLHTWRYDLATALREGNMRRARLLLRLFPRHPQLGRALYEATKAHDLDLVRWLLERGADPNYHDPSSGKAPLHLSAHVVGPKGSQPELSEALSAELLAHGADVDARDNQGVTPLMGCLTLGPTKLLVAHGADVNARDDEGRTPLIIAAVCSADPGRMRFLVEQGADPNARDKEGTPIVYHLARWPLQPGFFRVLLDRGLDPKAMDRQGRSAVHRFASRSGMRLDTLDFLLANGLRIDARDNDGATPLHVAMSSYYDYPALSDPRNCVRALLDRGADPKATDNAGRTALHCLAATEDCPRPLVDELLARGLDINAPDNEGETPLHVAVGTQVPRLEAIRPLLERGADPTARNAQGKTPRDLAAQRGLSWLIDELRPRAPVAPRPH